MKFSPAAELAPTGGRLAAVASAATATDDLVRCDLDHRPHPVGGRTRHAIGRQLSLVQLDQILHLPARSISAEWRI